MSDELEKLPVKNPSDLVQPEKPEVLHGKPVEVSDKLEADKFDVSLTFAEKLGLFLEGVVTVASKAADVVSDVEKILASLKWIALFVVAGGVLFVLLRAFHVI